MDYKQVLIETNNPTTKDILIALLSEEGYEGFEEIEGALIAFISLQDYDEPALTTILSSYQLSFTSSEIEKINWNKEWEENFQPVIVKDFCTVRADFHQIEIETPFEIVITPKMSFGTGHHATTQLMMQMMREIPFNNKSVFDFGTGTGILAILAALLGAKEITAIDNDEWSIENARENVERNNINNVTLQLGSLESFEKQQFDIILANINRHILLQFMPDLFARINGNGKILMSGLLQDDRKIIIEAALSQGFKFLKEEQENNWIALLFAK